MDEVDERMNHSLPTQMSGGNGAVRPLTFGAVLAVITTMLFVAQQTVPVLGTAAMFLCPVPIVLMHLVFRQIKHTLLLVLVAAALIGGISPLWALMFVCLFGASGVAMGLAAERSATAPTIVFASALAATAATGLLVLGSWLALEDQQLDAFLAKQRKDVNRFFDEQGTTLKQSNGSSEDLARLEEMRQFLLRNLPRFMALTPGMLAASSVFYALLNYLASRIVLRRFGMYLPEMPAFQSWRLPATIPWVLAAGAILAGVRGAEDGSMSLASVAGLNLFVLAVAASFVAGLSLLHHLFRSMRLSRGGMIVSYIFVAMFSLQLVPLLAMAGLLDHVFDVRHKMGLTPEGTSEELEEKENSNESHHDS